MVAESFLLFLFFLASIVVPNALFVISLSVLLYWYCPFCQARCQKYEEQIDQDYEDEEPR